MWCNYDNYTIAQLCPFLVFCKFVVVKHSLLAPFVFQFLKVYPATILWQWYFIMHRTHEHILYTLNYKVSNLYPNESVSKLYGVVILMYHIAGYFHEELIFACFHEVWYSCTGSSYTYIPDHLYAQALIN